MTSVAAPFHAVQPEIIETATTTSYDYEDYQETEHTEEYDNDVEMTDIDPHQLEEIPDVTGYEEQDTYNAEIESTVVEPPQSDAVLTHAPSTILDEMEYLEEEIIDYEEEDEDEQISQNPPPDIQLMQESDTYKGESTTAPTPPAHSPEDLAHLHLFSPANRPVPLPRPQTPHLATLVASTSATAAHTGAADEESGAVVDDDWPICLYVPGGQEYMLFRSDGDTEALFEDNWLKSQPLETFFSSVRQTLENELIPLTTAFAMDEIVLAIPDLDLSIAEDNCYTREISLQDLVNLINGICAKNGTERPNVCKLLLTFQQRFIARFNQLVAITSHSWETEKTTEDSGEGEEEEEEAQNQTVEEGLQPEDESMPHYNEEGNPDHPYAEEEHPEEAAEQVVAEEGAPEVEYEEYEDEGYDEGDESAVKFQAPVEPVEDTTVDQGEQVELDAAEEDELFEENEDTFDHAVEPTEAIVNQDDDVVVEVGGQYQDDEYEEGQDYTGEEHGDEAGGEITQDPGEEEPSSSIQVQNDTEADDDDDLISYEEAVDQTEAGQDYRQQFIAEQDAQESTTSAPHVNGHPQENGSSKLTVPAPEQSSDTLSEVPSTSENNAPTPKRPLDEVVDTETQTEEPPLKRAKS